MKLFSQIKCSDTQLLDEAKAIQFELESLTEDPDSPTVMERYVKRIERLIGRLKFVKNVTIYLQILSTVIVVMGIMIGLIVGMAASTPLIGITATIVTIVSMLSINVSNYIQHFSTKIQDKIRNAILKSRDELEMYIREHDLPRDASHQKILDQLNDMLERVDMTGIYSDWRIDFDVLARESNREADQIHDKIKSKISEMKYLAITHTTAEELRDGFREYFTGDFNKSEKLFAFDSSHFKIYRDLFNAPRESLEHRANSDPIFKIFPHLKPIDDDDQHDEFIELIDALKDRVRAVVSKLANVGVSWDRVLSKPSVKSVSYGFKVSKVNYLVFGFDWEDPSGIMIPTVRND